MNTHIKKKHDVEKGEISLLAVDNQSGSDDNDNDDIGLHQIEESVIEIDIIDDQTLVSNIIVDVLPIDEETLTVETCLELDSLN